MAGLSNKGPVLLHPRGREIEKGKETPHHFSNEFTTGSITKKEFRKMMSKVLPLGKRACQGTGW
jgi:hypothetical protein